MTNPNNLPFPDNAWSREEALRYTKNYPKVERNEGESEKEFKNRKAVALRNAASKMRLNYKLNAWKVLGSPGYWYDGDQVMRAFHENVVAV